MNKTAGRIREKNERHSTLFCAPSNVNDRNGWMARNKTRVVVQVCMDGRARFVDIVGFMPGIIEVEKSAGAMADFGNGYYGRVRFDQHMVDLSKSIGTLFVPTYHFSESDSHLGCKAHGYDTAKALASAVGLRDQHNQIFGTGQMFYGVCVGIETDHLGLVFHGEDSSKSVKVSESLSLSLDQVRRSLSDLYPGVNAPALNVLLELFLGNQKFLQSNTEVRRDLDHTERVVGYGRGLNFVYQSMGPSDPSLTNFLLEVSPMHEDSFTHLAIAIGILVDNVRLGRVPTDEGFVFLASAISEGIGSAHAFAVAKAEFGRRAFKRALELLETMQPENHVFFMENVAPHTVVMTGVLEQDTRRFEAQREEDFIEYIK